MVLFARALIFALLFFSTDVHRCLMENYGRNFANRCIKQSRYVCMHAKCAFFSFLFFSFFGYNAVVQTLFHSYFFLFRVFHDVGITVGNNSATTSETEKEKETGDSVLQGALTSGEWYIDNNQLPEQLRHAHAHYPGRNSSSGSTGSAIEEVSIGGGGGGDGARDIPHLIPVKSFRNDLLNMAVSCLRNCLGVFLVVSLMRFSVVP
jgi:hypothetical protein